MASSDGQNGMSAVPPAILRVLASQPSFLREDYVAASGGHEVAVWARLLGTTPYRRDLGECLMRKSRLAVLAVGLSLLAAGLLALPSSAATSPTRVTINLTTVVDLVDNPNGVPVGNIAPGDVIAGSYTYNPKAKDISPLVEFGAYPHNQQPYGIQLNLGSFSVETDPTYVDFQIAIGNYSNSDSYRVTSFNNVSTEPGPGVQIISWDLIDPMGTPCRTPLSRRPPPCCRRGSSTSSTSKDGKTLGISSEPMSPRR